MDSYTILGVNSNDNLDVIKQTYKKLANQFHPDKLTGDEEKFKLINKAWEDIKRANLKPRIHTPVDIYNFFQSQQVYQPIKVHAHISIHNAVNGGMHILNVRIVSSGNPVLINIEVPPGVSEGDTIRYSKILINKIDVLVVFHLVADNAWSIAGSDITLNETFDFWDLILGTTREIRTIYGERLAITVPPMTQPSTLLKLANKGIKKPLHSGDMYVKILAKLPNNIPDEVLSVIQNFN